MIEILKWKMDEAKVNLLIDRMENLKNTHSFEKMDKIDNESVGSEYFQLDTD